MAKYIAFKFMMLVVLMAATSMAAKDETTSINCSASAAPKEWFPALSNNQTLIDYNTSSPLGWGACSHFSRATCCEKVHTDSVTRLLVMMDRAGFSHSCMTATEKALCPLACDPDVGLGALPSVLCLSTCKEWYEACQDDFFSPVSPGIQRMPTPCSDSALVCSRLGDTVTSPQQMCEVMSVKWASPPNKCVSGLADPTRRGKVRPPQTFKSSFPSSGSPTVSMQYIVEMFWRDMRALQRFLRKMGGSYTTTIDKFLAKYGSYVAFTVPPVLVGMFLSFRARRDRNDDFR